MPQSPEELPITGMCIISDPQQCPPGYEVLMRSYDKQDDCDLWKDSFFRSKVTRYLCFTRIFPLDGGRLNNVLSDIVVNNERDPPPPGFAIVDFTVDSREKATRKRQICVQMLPRETTHDSICDVIILSRSKRPPIGYTLVGEINGLLICFKKGQVPSDTRSPVLPPHNLTSTSSHQLAGSSDNPPSNNAHYALNQRPVPSPPMHQSPIHNNFQRQDSLLLPGAGHASDDALEGVPFTLSPKYQDVHGLSLNNVPEVQYRSLVDIENEYSYNFRLERTAAVQQLGSTQ